MRRISNEMTPASSVPIPPKNTGTSPPTEHPYENSESLKQAASSPHTYQNAKTVQPREHQYENVTGRLSTKVNSLMAEITGLNKEYFHVKMSQVQADQILLQDPRDQLFLFRESSQAGAFAMSYKLSGKSCTPALLKFDGPRVCMVLGNEVKETYDNFAALIHASQLTPSDILEVDTSRMHGYENITTNPGLNRGSALVYQKFSSSENGIVDSKTVLTEKINGALQRISGRSANFFHENMSQENAEKLLSQYRLPDVFLFRESSRSGCFVLSYKEKGNQFGYSLLKFEGGGVHLIVSEKVEKTFESLDEFLKQPMLVSSQLIGVNNPTLERVDPSIYAAFPGSSIGKTSTSANLPSIAFGADKWSRYFGRVGQEPPLPEDINETLAKICQIFSDGTIGQKYFLTLIPETVDGKPFTLNLLEYLVRRPKQGGNASDFRMYSNAVRSRYGDIPITNSYWALVSRGVISESLKKPFGAQKRLIENLSKKTKIPYDIPTIVEIATSVLANYAETGFRSYGDSPLTYTACQEMVGAQYDVPVAVGGFSAEGLRIDDVNGGVERHGIAVSWRL